MVKAIRIISVTLLILWMSFIFFLSAQSAEESSDTSGGLIEAILKIFYPNFEKLAMIKQTEIISSLQFFVRKAAHFTIYGVLGIFSFFSFVTYKQMTVVLRITLSSALCLLYSVTDEIHQLFVAGRSGELRDVMIDFCGGMLAIAFLYLIIRLSKFKGVLAYEKKGAF